MKTNPIAMLLALALSGCATPASQSQPVPQVSACHTQLTNQRLFMLVAGRSLQKCIDRPGADTCSDAVTTMRIQDSLGIDHELFRSCFPEYLRTEREAFKETAVEISVFHRQLVKVEALVAKFVRAGHF